MKIGISKWLIIFVAVLLACASGFVFWSLSNDRPIDDHSTEQLAGLFDKGDKFNIDLVYYPEQITANATESVERMYEYTFTNDSDSLLVAKLITNPEYENMRLQYAVSSTPVTNYNNLSFTYDYQDQILQPMGTDGDEAYVYIKVSVVDTTKFAVFKSGVNCQGGEPVTITFNMGDGTTTQGYAIKGYPEPNLTLPSRNGIVPYGAYKNSAHTDSVTYPINEATTIYLKYYNLPVDWITYNDTTRSYHITTGTTRLPLKVEIPTMYNDDVNGYAYVTDIDANAFEKNTGITSVTIPNSIVNIGEDAFYYCENLTTVNYAEGSKLKYIGNGAFSCAIALTSITIPASVEELGESVFYYCRSALSITFEEDSLVTELPRRAFYCCDEVRELVLPKNLKVIGPYSLSAIHYIEELEIPSGVLEIQEYAFQYTALKSTLNITIPKGVVRLGLGAFYGCTGLASVTFEEGTDLTAIGNGAFYQCVSLTEIDIPDRVVQLRKKAFDGCTGLTSVTIPAATTYIGIDIFANCTALTEVIFQTTTNWAYMETNDSGETVYTNVPSADLGDGATALTHVNKGLRKMDTALTPSWYEWDPIEKGYLVVAGGYIEGNITIPETYNDGVHGEANVISIDSGVFVDSFNLTGITIAANVSTIGANAFDGCTGLQTVTFADNPKLTTIGDYAFQNCTSLSEISIPEGVTYFSPCLFSGCSALTTVSIPSTLTDIWEHTFSGCTSLTTVNIPQQGSQLDNIYSSSFKGCTALTSIFIPKTVTVVNYQAFYGCSALASITFEEGSQLKTLGQNAFSGTAIKTITLPASLQTLRGAEFSGCTNLEEVIFEEGCKIGLISASMFYGCTALKSINIPARVTSISVSAFSGCSSLESAVFEDTNGWTRGRSTSSMVAVDVTDPATAASLLKNSVVGRIKYIWRKTSS